MTKKTKLGFRFMASDTSLVDAKEYKKLLASGKLSDAESDWLKQFLKEYYTQNTAAVTVIHSEDQRLSNNRDHKTRLSNSRLHKQPEDSRDLLFGLFSAQLPNEIEEEINTEPPSKYCPVEYYSYPDYVIDPPTPEDYLLLQDIPIAGLEDPNSLSAEDAKTLQVFIDEYKPVPEKKIRKKHK